MDKKAKEEIKKEAVKVNELSDKDIVELIKEMFDGEEVEEINSQSVVLEIGDILCGTLISIEDSHDRKNRPIKTAIFQTKEGKKSMALPVSLQRTLESVEIGSQIGIIRIRDGITRDGNLFKRFRLFKPKK